MRRGNTYLFESPNFRGPMKNLLTVLTLLILLTGSVLAQSTIPPYHSQNDFLLASPGALKYGLYGFDNPALLSTLHQPDVGFAWSDRSGKWSDPKDWGLFLAVPHLGFGAVRRQEGPASVTDYRLSAGFGDRAASVGFGYGWSDGDTGILQRSDLIMLGILLRPNPFVSMGLTGTKAFGNSSAEAVADVAARPFGNELVTLFADYAIQNHQSLRIAPWSAGLALEPLPGIRLTGRYFDNKAFTVGFQLSLGHLGLTSQTHFDADRNHAYNTYGIRLGGYDRNVVDSYLKKKSAYVEMNLCGSIDYTKFIFFDDTRTLLGLLEAIDAAKADPSVAGIAINTSGLSSGRELLWEVREKLKDFKSSGKRVVIFIDRGNIDLYHFASVADKIVMDPLGMFMLEGYRNGRTYLKGTLEKLGIGYDEWRFFKYKSANESYSRDRMSEADREQRQKLVDDSYRLAKSDICEARGFSAARFDSLVNNEIGFLAPEALQRGLVDTLGRWETVKDLVTKLEAGHMGYMDAGRLARFQLPSDNRWGEKPRIAVIYALGACDMDEGIAARSLVGIVDAAVSDPRIKGIVLRVDSPGGDAMASDYIAEALKKAKGKKPVIVSQGAVAASGGYWLSMYADTIVAAPTTITGSVGVIGGWLYNKSLKEWAGMSTDLVKAGEHADLGYGFTLPIIGNGIPDRNLTPEERSRVEQGIRAMYREFVAKVASGRKMTTDQIDAIGQGRVWSGYDGKEIGLVDLLGGLETAISVAKEKAGIAPGEETEIVEMPKRGLFNLGFLKPKLMGIDLDDNAMIRDLRFRLKHNGESMPMLPMEDPGEVGAAR
jgi:protease IV